MNELNSCVYKKYHVTFCVLLLIVKKNIEMIRELEFAFLDENKVLTCKQQCPKIPSVSLRGTIFSRLNAHSDHVTLIEAKSGRHMCSSEVKELTSKLASILREIGIKAGDVVFFMSSNTSVVSCLTLACIMIRATITGTYPDDSVDDSLFQAYDSNASAVVCDSGTIDSALLLVERLADIQFLIVIDEVNLRQNKIEKFGKKFVSLPSIIDRHVAAEVAESGVEQTSEVVVSISYTTGSSGKPKGVLHSQLNYIASLFLCEEGSDFRASQGCVYYTTAPPVFDMSITHLLSAIFFGYSLLLDEKCIDAETFFSKVATYQVTDALLSSLQATMISKSCSTFGRNVISLQRILSVNFSLSDAIVEKLGMLIPNLNVQQNYGTTEVGVICLMPDVCNRTNSIGRPHLGISVKVVDPETKLALGPNEEGEIWVKTSSKLLGYYKQSRTEFEENFTSDGWFKTSDIGYYGDDGLLFIHGRIRDIIHNITLRSLRLMLDQIGSDDVIVHAGSMGIVIMPRGSPACQEIQITDDKTLFEHVIWMESTSKRCDSN